MNPIGLCIPPPAGEVDVVYSASVVERLRPKFWYDHRFQQIGAPGYIPTQFDGDVERMVLCAGLLLTHPQDVPPYVFLFNEPERADQANITPEDAHKTLRRWWARVPAWYCDVAVGGVNVSMHHGDAPYQWLRRFVQRLSDADRKQVRYWHIHAYGNRNDTTAAVRRFREWMYGVRMVRPVILSECGTDDDPATLMRWLRKAVAVGALHDVFWFASYYADWNDTGVLDASGALTAIGEAWMQEEQAVYIPRVSVGAGI